MHDRPSREELLAAVRRFLEEDVVPATTGRRQFLARVAAHSLTIVERELRLADEQLRREWDGLDALLGAEPLPAEPSRVAGELLRRNRVLAERIREGAFDADGALRARLLAHLRETVRAKLEVADPGLLERDAAGASSGREPS